MTAKNDKWDRRKNLKENFPVRCEISNLESFRVEFQIFRKGQFEIVDLDQQTVSRDARGIRTRFKDSFSLSLRSRCCVDQYSLSLFARADLFIKITQASRFARGCSLTHIYSVSRFAREEKLNRIL